MLREQLLRRGFKLFEVIDVYHCLEKTQDRGFLRNRSKAKIESGTTHGEASQQHHRILFFEPEACSLENLQNSSAYALYWVWPTRPPKAFKTQPEAQTLKICKRHTNSYLSPPPVSWSAPPAIPLPRKARSRGPCDSGPFVSGLRSQSASDGLAFTAGFSSLGCRARRFEFSA